MLIYDLISNYANRGWPNKAALSVFSVFASFGRFLPLGWSLSPAPALSLVRAFWGPVICAKCFIVCLFFFSWSPRAGLLTIMNGARYLWYGKVGLNILDTYTAPWAFAFPFDLSFIVRCLSCSHVG